MKPSRFPAIDLARECASLLEVLLEEKGQRLIIEAEEDTMLYGDWLLLRQALELPKVFDRFYRVEQGRTRESGTGLGLAITRWRVEIHGGIISAHASKGSGSTFRMVLPASGPPSMAAR